jgi:hypothetical protein
MSEQGWIIRVEALRLSKIAIKQKIRDRGERLKDYSMCEITKLAELWRDCHPELIEQATITIGLLFRRKLRSGAPKKEDGKSIASLVQKLGAK